MWESRMEIASANQNHKCDERTTEWFKSKPSWYVCGLSMCEKCGLMYNPALGHACPRDTEEPKEDC